MNELIRIVFDNLSTRDFEIDSEMKKYWAKGEWDDEPDYEYWVDENTNLVCFIQRNADMGFLCGYVAFDIKYKDLNVEECDVHGGITLDGQNNKKTHRIVGFDCGHYYDYGPFMIIYGPGAEYRNFAYVKNQCQRLADYIAEQIRLQEKETTTYYKTAGSGHVKVGE